MVAAGPTDGSDKGLIVLLHGYPNTASQWRQYIPHYASQGYRVLAPDMRGVNDSIPTSDNLSFEVLSSDVQRLIESEGRESAILITHDWGSAVGWHFAITRPSFTRAFVAMSIPHLELYRANGTHSPRRDTNWLPIC